jgi:hypothetical protein
MGERQAGEVIWQRTIDRAAIAGRRRKFYLWYCVPVLVLAVIVGVVTEPFGALGVLIFFGLFGVLLGGWVFIDGFSRSSNPVLTRDGDVLRHNKRTAVPIGQVTKWTTFPRAANFTFYNGSFVQTTHNESLYVAAFLVEARQLDGTTHLDTKELVWSLLTDDDTATLRAAIERELPNRWVPVDEFRTRSA